MKKKIAELDKCSEGSVIGIYEEGGKEMAAGWTLEVDIDVIRDICRRRGYSEYKKGMMRVIEDFLDEEVLEFRGDKPYKDIY